MAKQSCSVCVCVCWPENGRNGMYFVTNRKNNIEKELFQPCGPFIYSNFLTLLKCQPQRSWASSQHLSGPDQVFCSFFFPYFFFFFLSRYGPVECLVLWCAHQFLATVWATYLYLLFSLSSYHFWTQPFVELKAMLSSNLLIMWSPISHFVTPMQIFNFGQYFVAHSALSYCKRYRALE